MKIAWVNPATVAHWRDRVGGEFDRDVAPLKIIPRTEPHIKAVDSGWLMLDANDPQYQIVREKYRTPKPIRHKQQPVHCERCGSTRHKLVDCYYTDESFAAMQKEVRNRRCCS